MVPTEKPIKMRNKDRLSGNIVPISRIEKSPNRKVCHSQIFVFEISLEVEPSVAITAMKMNIPAITVEFAISSVPSSIMNHTPCPAKEANPPIIMSPLPLCTLVHRVAVEGDGVKEDEPVHLPAELLSLPFHAL